ncbi:MAG: ribokinase [Candidatus Poribacteria bacterium]|nr:ribokinase [Candidatus Poribacteria bacterium]
MRNSRTPKVTVVGSLNIDLVCHATKRPDKGETLIGDAFDIFTGGKGFNQATAAARLGAEVTLIGSVGADSFGEMLLIATENEHIDSRFVRKRTDTGTGVATIVVEPDGDNSIIVVPRANMALTTTDIDAAADCISDADVLLLQLETPIAASEHAAAIAKAHGTTVILNPAPAQPLPDSLLASVDILTPNQSETEFLSGIQVSNDEDARNAAEVLRARMVDTTTSAVVLTLGEQGALILTSRTSERIPAFSVDAVDTTGAGDAFCGALATALASGETLGEAIALANAAGAVAVTVIGATPSMPTRAKVDLLMSQSHQKQNG